MRPGKAAFPAVAIALAIAALACGGGGGLYPTAIPTAPAAPGTLAPASTATPTRTPERPGWLSQGGLISTQALLAREIIGIDGDRYAIKSMRLGEKNRLNVRYEPEQPDFPPLRHAVIRTDLLTFASLDSSVELDSNGDLVGGTLVFQPGASNLTTRPDALLDLYR